MVREEGTIVNTLQFDTSVSKSTLHGQVISLDNTNVGTQFADSSYHVKNTIASICSKLSLGSDHVERAFRWYKLCLQYSLSKGKSILYTLSACVYITCRQEATPHLLIDFSNALRIDMYKIGRVFLRLRNLLGVDISLADPSLYMHRFVSQLKFQNRDILDYSVRLVSRMRKDWILTGRRPNNSCGAALLIASRIFGEERSITDISRAVHSSPSTILKRLHELSETRSAELGIEEFKFTWIDEEENPPVAKTAENRKQPVRRARSVRKAAASEEETEQEEDVFDYDQLILNEEEITRKEELWESLYGDFVQEQEKKRKHKSKAVVKRRKSKHGYNTLEEALKSLDNKVSSKLNYSAIEKLFNSH